MVLYVNNIISDIYKEIHELKKSFSDEDIEFTYCFRGEGRDYGQTKLTPTLFREELLSGKRPDKELINLITDYKICESEQIHSLAKAIEGQHFLELSRLLDVTFSILPSLFFASNVNNNPSYPNEYFDGYIYIFQFPKTYSPSSSYIREYYEKLIEEEIIPYYQNFKVLAHTQSNERIKSQSGGFILFPGDKIKKIPEIYYRKVRIKKEYKNAILEELDSYFNINTATIYPEKDKKKELVKKKLYLIANDLKRMNGEWGFYKSEIEEALTRMKYEISGLKNSKESRKHILRVLRKEKSDLISYIQDLIDKLGLDKDSKKEEFESEMILYINNEIEKLKFGI